MLRGLTLSLTRYRHVLTYFIVSDLKVRYRRSVAGYFWTLLEPLSLVLTYYFLFTVIAKVDRPGYPVLLIVGVLPWTYFQTVISTGAYVLVGNAPLIQKVFLPRELFMLSQAGYNLAVFLLSMLVVVPFLLWFGIYPSPARLLLLVPAIVSLSLLAVGIALVASCVNVVYRDVGDILRVGMRLAIYASPVVYTVDMVPERFRSWYMLNPVSVCLELFRQSLLDAPLRLTAVQILYGTGVSVATFLVGLAFFARYEARLVKYL
jgi:ABC-2 type transport system permease protein